MAKLKDKLKTLYDSKENIYKSLSEKDSTVTEETLFEDYPEHISGISGGGGTIELIDTGMSGTNKLYDSSDLTLLCDVGNIPYYDRNIVQCSFGIIDDNYSGNVDDWTYSKDEEGVVTKVATSDTSNNRPLNEVVHSSDFKYKQFSTLSNDMIKIQTPILFDQFYYDAYNYAMPVGANSPREEYKKVYYANRYYTCDSINATDKDTTVKYRYLPDVSKTLRDKLYESIMKCSVSETIDVSIFDEDNINGIPCYGINIGEFIYYLTARINTYGSTVEDASTYSSGTRIIVDLVCNKHKIYWNGYNVNNPPSLYTSFKIYLDNSQYNYRNLCYATNFYATGTRDGSLLVQIAIDGDYKRMFLFYSTMTSFGTQDNYTHHTFCGCGNWYTSSPTATHPNNYVALEYKLMSRHSIHWRGRYKKDDVERFMEDFVSNAYKPKHHYSVVASSLSNLTGENGTTHEKMLLNKYLIVSSRYNNGRMGSIHIVDDCLLGNTTFFLANNYYTINGDIYYCVENGFLIKARDNS